MMGRVVPENRVISFLTPYWSGAEMMQVHLASIRRFHPTAPIFVSKKDGGHDEMEAYRAAFGIECWFEECDYVDATLRLLARCPTEYVCLIEHDVVLLSSLDGLLNGLVEGRWDLVGMEERVRDFPDREWEGLGLPGNGWLRFAPGHIAGPLLLFNWREFKRRWGLTGVRGKRRYGVWEYEYDHGISQKLRRHKYLHPYHTHKYGIGNVLKDDETPIAWHQWYGAYRTRFHDSGADEAVSRMRMAYAKQTEAAFLADYPTLDLSALTPAWGPGWDIAVEQLAAERARPGVLARGIARVKRWRSYGLDGLAARAVLKLDRWRRLL